MKQKKIIEEFWMVNAIDRVELMFEGDMYVFTCDMTKEENWYSFPTKKKSGRIIETFMFRFELVEVVEIDDE